MVRVAASTAELALFRGDGAEDGVLLYVRVTRPTALAFVLPGTLSARALAVDLSEVATPAQRLRLSEPARIHVALERRAPAGWRRVRRAAFGRPAGAGVVVLRRDTGGRALMAGRYRVGVRVRAVDAAGLLSRKRSASFRLR